jgi:hypothetical protein
MRLADSPAKVATSTFTSAAAWTTSTASMLVIAPPHQHVDQAFREEKSCLSMRVRFDDYRGAIRTLEAVRRGHSVACRSRREREHLSVAGTRVACRRYDRLAGLTAPCFDLDHLMR